MEIAVHQARLGVPGLFLGQAGTEPRSRAGQLLGGALHQPGPAHHLLGQRHRRLAPQAGVLKLDLLQPMQSVHCGGRDRDRGNLAHQGLDAGPLDRLHQAEGAAVEDVGVVLVGDDPRGGQPLLVERRHDPALAEDVGGAGDPGPRRRQPQHVALAPGAVAGGDEVGEPGVPFGDGDHGRELEPGAIEMAPQVRLQSIPEGLGRGGPGFHHVSPPSASAGDWLAGKVCDIGDRLNHDAVVLDQEHGHAGETGSRRRGPESSWSTRFR